ncbi:ABC transporter permease subunit [Actinobaculum sp. 352]|uniref:ABC transporter permease n=1 Tax=Actinobaculum sp. 352 TaxID=2490946 RepID=UPI000F7DFDDA|nr:ABC transporter permease subunit [Actinobaculum sp. 352]RTE49498.1 ABC transporter permease subunit [Actinobaculum sp. 352]
MSWIIANLPMLGERTLSHLVLSVPAIILSFVLALPIAVLANRLRRLRSFLIGAAGLIYAIPSLPMFIVLPLIVGTTIRDRVNVVIAMTLYGVALMVRSAADAFTAVDLSTKLAATATGYSPIHRFFAVDLPLAGPALLAGLRVVAVSTVSLVTVSALLGVPNLGMLFTDGIARGITAEILAGIVLTVTLALLIDGALVLAGRLLMRWERAA